MERVGTNLGGSSVNWRPDPSPDGTHLVFPSFGSTEPLADGLGDTHRAPHIQSDILVGCLGLHRAMVRRADASRSCPTGTSGPRRQCGWNEQPRSRCRRWVRMAAVHEAVRLVAGWGMADHEPRLNDQAPSRRQWAFVATRVGAHDWTTELAAGVTEPLLWRSLSCIGHGTTRRQTLRPGWTAGARHRARSQRLTATRRWNRGMDLSSSKSASR